VALMLEVLDQRTGEVRQRYRLEGGPITLGRGYDNDVVLDDPYVDAHHARIGFDETGAATIEDLGSVNALIGPGATRRVRVPARAGTVVRIGRTLVRFQDTEAALPAALPDTPLLLGRTPGARWLGTWWGQLGVAAIATVAVAWSAWLGTYSTSSAAEAVGLAVSFLIAAVLWAGTWAVASRVVVHRFRFPAHLAVASAVVLAGLGYSVASGWVAFLFPDHGLGRPVELIVGLLFVAIPVAMHLSLASSLTRRRRWTAAFVTSGMVLVIGAVLTLAEDDSFTDSATFAGELKPVPTALLPTSTAEEFGVVATDLKREVDELAAARE